MPKSFARALVDNQRQLCKRFDKFLPSSFSVDGYTDFKSAFVAPFIAPDKLVCDVGGGKRPFFSIEEKEKLRLRVVGMDISQDELNSAPNGSYDESICADITTYRGNAEADIAICCTLLEHVRDTDAAIACIASILKKGGIALIFVPSRRAVFARLNRAIPEALKRRILFSIFPEKAGAQGFPSFYDRCSPEEIRSIGEKYGLKVVDSRFYFVSSYFSFLLPLYVTWRLWVVLYKAFIGNNAAETFSYALKKA